METSSFDENEHSCTDLEGAITNIEQFAKPSKSLQIPLLCNLCIENGRLKNQKLTTLGKTILFAKDCLFRLFSEKKGNERIAHQKAIKGALLQSLDLLKIYSAAIDKMRKGSREERQLASRLERCASEYNSIVSKVKENQFSIVAKAKKFFLNIAGWEIVTDTQLHEIHMPRSCYCKIETGFTDFDHAVSHKTTGDIQQDLSKKISFLLKSLPFAKDFDPSVPRQCEIDALKMKALLFLQRHIGFCHLSLRELISLVQVTKIEAISTLEAPHNIKEPIITLRQTFSCFPGEDTEFVGSFQRDVKNPQISIPIKHSFKGTTNALCSGFSFPIQHFGFAFSEKLLPSFLLRPNLVPTFNEILLRRQKIIQKLTLGEPLNLKAKILLKIQKELIESHKNIFFQRISELIRNMIDSSEDIQDKELAKSIVDEFYGDKITTFDLVAKCNKQVIDSALVKPFDHIQEKWILQKSPELSKDNPDLALSFCTFVFEEQRNKIFEHDDQQGIQQHYEKILSILFFEIAKNINLMQLSEHFQFKPKVLSKLSRQGLTCTIYQQIIFLNTLEELELDSHPRQEAFEMLKILENECTLFTQNPVMTESIKESLHIADEIFSYFSKDTTDLT